MEQIVRVREIYDDGTAQVLLIRESACSGDCHKCSGCGAAKETLLVTAVNPIRADRGDLVTIRSESGPVLKAAAVLYMMPLVLFFLGYGLGAALAISGAFLCYNEDGSVYVWAEKNGKLEKRSVTVGEYNFMLDTVEILEGLTEEDYIAFPDPELCVEGAPTTREQPVPEGGVE